MQNVHVIRQFKIDMTPEQWAMYDMAGAAKAAREINRLVEEILNSTNDRRTAMLRIDDVLRQYRTFGVDDTEGRVAASQLIEYVFPTPLRVR